MNNGVMVCLHLPFNPDIASLSLSITLLSLEKLAPLKSRCVSGVRTMMGRWKNNPELGKRGRRRLDDLAPKPIYQTK